MKKVPMRKCVITGTMHPKRELIRVVRSKEGEVSVDETGKKSGRGAYLAMEKETILLAKKKRTLDNHLSVKVPDKIYDELLVVVERKDLV